MTFREYLIECEISDFFLDIKSYQDFFNKNNNINNKFPLILPIHEAVILPENIKINSDLNDIESLNKEFSKIGVEFEIVKNPNDLRAYYDKENDSIKVFYSILNSKLEIEAIIGHEMIHKEQHKRAGVHYFERAKKLTDEINKLISIYNNTFNKEIFKEIRAKLKFKDFDDSYEQMAYVYQTVKEHPDFTPNQLVKYFSNFGFKIDFKLKKYIGMYWLIKDKIK